MRRLLLLLLCAGCVAESSADGGVDAALDAPAPRDVPRDLGPACELSCGLGEGCCVVDGAPVCTQLTADIRNCGECGLDCLATGRGGACMEGRCACGRFEIGCSGGPDICCPAVAGGREAHCANLDVAEEDCGACGRACEPATADLCRNGTCVCSGSDRACDGTAGDTCCPGGVGATVYRCVDTLGDREHCGSCGRRCRLDQRCDGGRCASIFDAPTADVGAADAGAEGGLPDVP
jgi:hypothetical protein